MSTTPPTPLFTSQPPERTRLPLAAAGLGVLLLLAGIVALSRRPAHRAGLAALTANPYASSLKLDQIAMSESTSLSGGKSTFIDGHLHNAGTRTVTGAHVQVLFRNDVQLPPQVESLPLMLIRTHEPYVDVQSLAASPLRPGDDREFRLTFESIGANWNGQLPEIRITQTTLK